jgi:hypothetical protein
MHDEQVPGPPPGRYIPRTMRSIEAAAIAGLLHSVLSLAATGMLLSAPDPADGDQVIADWYLNDGNQRTLILAVNLLTISSIMFVWFVAVIRRRVGERENRFFGTVFFGSALLLTGAWLVAMTQAGGLTMASIVATRLEAVFMIASTTVGRLSEAFPRWLVLIGYAVGVTLLLMPVPNEALTWVFPIWVAVVSAVLLIRRDAIQLRGLTPPG